jgi:hypothetical protein
MPAGRMRGTVPLFDAPQPIPQERIDLCKGHAVTRRDLPGSGDDGWRGRDSSTRHSLTDAHVMPGWAEPRRGSRGPEVTEQSAKARGHVQLRDVVAQDLAVQARTPLRAHGDRGNDRQLVVAAPAPEHGRLAARRPGMLQRRNEQEPGFVKEHDVGLQAPGVFLPWPALALPAAGRLPRFVRTRAVPASARSGRDGAGCARHDRGGIRPRPRSSGSMAWNRRASSASGDPNGRIEGSCWSPLHVMHYSCRSQ